MTTNARIITTTMNAAISEKLAFALQGGLCEDSPASEPPILGAFEYTITGVGPVF